MTEMSNTPCIGICPGDDIAEVRFFDRNELAELQKNNLLTGVMIEALTRFGWLDALAEAA